MTNNYLALLKRVLSLIASNSSGPVPQGASKTESIYHINTSEGRVALPGDNQEVIAVTETCQEFAKTLNNRDYTELDSKAEYYLYTINHLIALVESKDEQNTKKHFQDYQLKCKYEGCRFISVGFNPNLDQADVVYAVKASIIEATDKYLQSLKTEGKGKSVSKKATLERDYTLALVKERGVWKINDFNAAEAVRVVEE